MIEHSGENYCNAREAAALLHVSRATFYSNVKGMLRHYKLPGRKTKHYKVQEVEQCNRTEVVELVVVQ